MLRSLLLMLVVQSVVAATGTAEDRESNWFGFVRRDFEVDGHSAILCCPTTTAEGRPWILAN